MMTKDSNRILIKITNVKKVFGENILFDNVNLSVEKGEFVIFSGDSGCGKTTLLNMIGALEDFDEGSIMVGDIDVSRKKGQYKYFSETVGFLFQNFALIEDKTVRQNLEIINKKNRTEITFEEALGKVGLLDKMDSKVYTLSGGEQQRIALARLMIKKCDLILADEPTGSLDKRNAAIVMDILKRLNEKGKTVILVSHDEEIKRQGSRLIEIAKMKNS